MKYALLLAAALAAIALSSAWAEDSQGGSEQPYIDQLKKTIPPKSSEGYTDEQRAKLPPASPDESYTEKLRQTNPALQLQGTPGPSYSEEKKQQLPPKETGGAIEAVKEGKSDLKKIKSTDIHGAAGIRVGMYSNRNFSANYGIGTGRNFSDVYGSGFAPDIGLFFEHQFFHNEGFASLGAFGMIDVARYSGSGTFSTTLHSGFDQSQIPSSATGTTYIFWEFPLTAGATFRLNLGKYFRPYAMLGPTIIPFAEYRSDGGNTDRGLSFGGFGAVGMAFLLDWISKDVDWDAYADFGIKHTYFTLELAGTECIPLSAITFNSAGLFGGFTFEF